MSVGKMWDDAQANARKILGKDGKLPEMPVGLEQLVEDYNRALDEMKPGIESIGTAWTKAMGKSKEIGEGCDSNSKAVQGADFGMDSTDPAQAKKQKAAKAVLTNALTAIKGTTFKNKGDNVNWVMKQVQAVLK